MLQSKIILYIISLSLGSAFLTAEEEDIEKTNSIIGYGDALVLGLVEGVTEFLPISSTGHLILVKERMMDPSSMDAPQEEAVDAYLIVIQASKVNPYLYRIPRKHNLLSQVIQVWFKFS